MLVDDRRPSTDDDCVWNLRDRSNYVDDRLQVRSVEVDVPQVENAWANYLSNSLRDRDRIRQLDHPFVHPIDSMDITRDMMSSVSVYCHYEHRDYRNSECSVSSLAYVEYYYESHGVAEDCPLQVIQNHSSSLDTHKRIIKQYFLFLHIPDVMRKYNILINGYDEVTKNWIVFR